MNFFGNLGLGFEDQSIDKLAQTDERRFNGQQAVVADVGNDFADRSPVNPKSIDHILRIQLVEQMAAEFQNGLH